MATFTGLISGFAAGDDVDVTRTVPGVPASQTLTKAWLTLKTNVSDTDVNALLQKAITSASVGGVGQITDTGASGTGSLLFQLTGANTLALPVGPIYYDIKVLTSASKVYTVEQGKYISTPRITTATS